LSGFWIGWLSSFFLVITGICGDLFVSMIKRRLGIKDTSNMLGSHGGWLDRTDGVKMAIIAYTPFLFF
jgi:phosphatidate cytidylyltransferase